MDPADIVYITAVVPAVQNDKHLSTLKMGYYMHQSSVRICQ